ncbi:MAG TPA: LppX_LprAFG lipoprotein [Pseudonocardiaceae bacterium]|jgi:lipoprotein LprG|nr:LppX_LprAFG lipoprotein [Pseudonocardiaceae bacterium]
MPHRRARPTAVFATLVATIAMVVAGCTGSSNGSGNSGGANLPAPGPLLAAASTSMSDVHSVHFTINVTGSVPTLPISNAEGDLNSAGQATGSGKLVELGQLIEVKFVLTNKTFYLLGPTGGWQHFPASLAGSLFDPAAILDPNRGVAQTLKNVTGAQTVGQETVNGVSAYKITGKVSNAVVSGLLPGLGSDVNATVWLATDAKHLPVKADFGLSGGTVEVTVSNYNEAMSVSAPS